MQASDLIGVGNHLREVAVDRKNMPQKVDLVITVVWTLYACSSLKDF